MGSRSRIGSALPPRDCGDQRQRDDCAPHLHPSTPSQHLHHAPMSPPEAVLGYLGVHPALLAATRVRALGLPQRALAAGSGTRGPRLLRGACASRHVRFPGSALLCFLFAYLCPGSRRGRESRLLTALLIGVAPRSSRHVTVIVRRPSQRDAPATPINAGACARSTCKPGRAKAAPVSPPRERRVACKGGPTIAAPHGRGQQVQPFARVSS